MDRGSTTRAERGNATVFVLMFVAIAAVLASGVAVVGQGSVERSRAQSVADLTALAAVVHGERAAGRVAAANGAALRSLSHRDRDVHVVVERNGHSASATGGPGDHSG